MANIIIGIHSEIVTKGRIEIIYSYLLRHISARAVTLAHLTGHSRASASKFLARLKDRGILSRTAIDTWEIPDWFFRNPQKPKECDWFKSERRFIVFDKTFTEKSTFYWVSRAEPESRAFPFGSYAQQAFDGLSSDELDAVKLRRETHKWRKSVGRLWSMLWKGHGDDRRTL